MKRILLSLLIIITLILCCFSCGNSSNDGYNHYEKIDLGKYTGNDIPKEQNEPCDFDYGAYYTVIKSYDELTNCIENLKNVDESFFKENYILVIGEYYSTSRTFEITKYKEIKCVNDKVELEVEAITEIDCSPATHIYNTMIVIPHIEMPKNGKLSIIKTDKTTE